MSVAVQSLPLLVIERRLRSTGGPGIIPFELAGTDAAADRIVGLWGAEGCRDARLSLLLDFQYPAAYAALHALVCARAEETLSRAGRTWLAALGPAVGWLQLIAAMFDYVENVSLLLVLGGRRGKVPRVARRAALAKFAAMSGGYSYMAVAAIAARRPTLPAEDAL